MASSHVTAGPGDGSALALVLYPNAGLEVRRGAGRFPVPGTVVALAASIEEFLEGG